MKKIYFKETDKKIKLKDPNNYLKRSQAIRLHLTKNNINIFEVMKAYKFNLYTCAFCGEYNKKFNVVTKIVNNEIQIIGLEYTCGDTYNYCWRGKNCSGSSLNSNSIEFVSRTKNISNEDALKIIHNRNSSPFYKCNHDTKEEHSKYQSRGKEWREINNISDEEWSERFKYKHLPDDEREILDRYWNRPKEIASNISKYTLEYYIQLYNEEKGKLEYLKYHFGGIIAVSGSKEDYELFLRFCYNILERRTPKLFIMRSFDVFDFLVNNFILIKVYLEYFKISKYEFIISLKTLFNNINSVDSSDKQIQFGNMHWFDGKFFRSNNELNFYVMLKEIGYDSTEILVDEIYTNSTLRYDFYLPDIEVYIEIAGMMNRPKYVDKMKLKNAIFGSWIVEPEEFEETIVKLKEMRNK